MVTSSPHVRGPEEREVPEHTKLWLNPVAKRQGLSVLYPDARLHEFHSLIFTNEVVQLQTDKHFLLLVTNFSNHPSKIKDGKVIAQAIPHPTRTVETNMSLEALLRVAGEGAMAMDPLHFAAPLSSATPEDHESPSVYHLVPYYLNEDAVRQVRGMLCKYNAIWDVW